MNGLYMYTCIPDRGIEKCSSTTSPGQISCFNKCVQIQLGIMLQIFARVDFSMLLKKRAE